jgi:hypothetical protein
MKTIHRNKIKHIVVHLVDGCEVEIATRRKVTKSRAYQKPEHLISFGTDDQNRDINFYHSVSQDGATLDIDTIYDENFKILSRFSFRFIITLPEGVHLKFTYTPSPGSFHQ